MVLGNAYLDSHELRTRAVTWADLRATQTGAAVWVGVFTDRRILVIHHAFRPGGSVQVLETGASLPWNTCALGKAIAAFLPAEHRKELLAGELPGAPAPASKTRHASRRSWRMCGRSDMRWTTRS